MSLVVVDNRSDELKINRKINELKQEFNESCSTLTERYKEDRSNFSALIEESNLRADVKKKVSVLVQKGLAEEETRALTRIRTRISKQIGMLILNS